TPRRLDDGSIQWTSPTGHTYLEPAATYPIDHTTDPPASKSVDAVSGPDPPPF
ncbi:MAG: hypothetical protein QOF95_2415, partial [Pseudonocardiales bacterium]|nr:hypothetical protein [Pseudonocardiales bacterium]